ncbi:MAG: phosphoglucomutase/phosphomannomutase family protein, partial [Clostridia bacterium]|nr:phosphoglucomutase/phosphomannomutase family protein [Clostridia bacterium]
MIQFGTGGWRAIIGEHFTKANIQRVACSVARRMKKEGVDQEGFCIGYDRRFLSRESAIWFSEVMAAQGIPLYFVNLAAPTPQIMFTVKHMALPYGAAITASHNPAIYNGIKLFTRGGRDAIGSVTSQIQQEANGLDETEIAVMPFEDALHCGQVRFIDPRDAYLDSIMEKIDM